MDESTFNDITRQATMPRHSPIKAGSLVFDLEWLANCLRHTPGFLNCRPLKILDDSGGEMRRVSRQKNPGLVLQDLVRLR